RHLEAPLETAAGGHDLPPDGRHRARRQRPGIVGLQAGDDRRLALRTEHRRVVPFLDLPDFQSAPGTLRKQRQHLPVDRVDRRPKPAQFFRHPPVLPVARRCVAPASCPPRTMSHARQPLNRRMRSNDLTGMKRLLLSLVLPYLVAAPALASDAGRLPQPHPEVYVLAAQAALPAPALLPAAPNP